MGAAEAWSAGLSGNVAPEQIVGLHLTQEMFPLLGVPPFRGRTFSADDFEPGKNHVLVISHDLWQSRFGAAQDIVGRKVLLDNEAYTVIGVMPQDFRFAPFWITNAEMWAPLDLTGREHQRGFNSLRVFARLKSGVSIRERAGGCEPDRGEFGGGLSGNQREYAGGGRIAGGKIGGASAARARNDAGRGGDGAADRVRECRQPGAGARHGETKGNRHPAVAGRAAAADRAAISDGKRVALDGGRGVGVLLAQSGLHALQAMLRPDSGSFTVRLAQWNQIGLDARVLMFTLVLAIATGVLFGLAPAISRRRAET